MIDRILMGMLAVLAVLASLGFAASAGFTPTSDAGPAPVDIVAGE